MHSKLRRCLLSLTLLAGCATEQPSSPLETRLDPQSAVTVQAMGEPYVFAHEAASLAANARDYLDLRCLEIDRMGKRTYLLSLVAFSTVDRHGASNPVAGQLGSIRLHAGDNIATLEAVGAGDDAYGLSQRLFARRNGQVASAEYLITPQLIRDLAATVPAKVSVELGADGELRYATWRPAREGLAALAEALPRGAR